MTREAMIDLETMSTSKNAPIVQIGAVLWDSEKGQLLGSPLLIQVNLDDELRRGFLPSASTFMWWLEQSEDARKALVAVQKKAVSTLEALTTLAEWLAANKPEFVWAKGPSFDLAILANHYEALGRPLPWKYNKEMCVRTAIRDAGLDEESVTFDGVAHNPVHDCVFQIKCVQLAKKLPFNEKSFKGI